VIGLAELGSRSVDYARLPAGAVRQGLRPPRTIQILRVANGAAAQACVVRRGYLGALSGSCRSVAVWSAVAPGCESC